MEMNCLAFQGLGVHPRFFSVFFSFCGVFWLVFSRSMCILFFSSFCSLYCLSIVVVLRLLITTFDIFILLVSFYYCFWLLSNFFHFWNPCFTFYLYTFNIPADPCWPFEPGLPGCPGEPVNIFKSIVVFSV